MNSLPISHMPHAYTEHQFVEQPAIGLFTEQSALPNPQPGLSATLLPLGEGLGNEGAQLTLPLETITAAGDELSRDLLLPRLLSGHVNMKMN